MCLMSFNCHWEIFALIFTVDRLAYLEILLKGFFPIN